MYLWLCSPQKESVKLLLRGKYQIPKFHVTGSLQFYSAICIQTNISNLRVTAGENFYCVLAVSVFSCVNELIHVNDMIQVLITIFTYHIFRAICRSFV